jgi:hypothetical protein
MKIVGICHEDYANYGYENTQAMKSVGLNAECFSLKRHPFYSKQNKILSSDLAKEKIKQADVIVVYHSCGTSYDLVKQYKGQKKIIVFHTGTRYRSNPEKHNNRWNDLADHIVIALGEFENLGAKNPIYLGITVNEKSIIPDFRTALPLRIAHYPSNPEVKGTATINSVIERLRKKHKFTYNHSTQIVGIDQQLRRMNNCDIYIELCAPKQGDNPYGSFGTTAVEAAAMGKIVVTNNLWQELYNSEYKNCALQIANSEQQLEETISELLQMHTNDLIKLKVLSRNWVEECHSYEATGKRMKMLIDL